MIGRSSPHTGLDYPQASGTPIPAIGTGPFTASGWNVTVGNYAAQQMPDGKYVAYLHMNSMSPRTVGEVVGIGDLIGYVGNTGTSSQGSHLHITISTSELAYLGYPTREDPYAYIQAHLDPIPPKPTQAKDEDMKLIQAPQRGIAVIGPAYFKSLTPEELPYAVRLYGDPIVGNEREFDLMRSIATNGSQH